MPLDLSEVELPPNHPFAVKQAVSKEEEALIRARLNERSLRGGRATAAAQQQQAGGAAGSYMSMESYEEGVSNGSMGEAGGRRARRAASGQQ